MKMARKGVIMAVKTTRTTVYFEIGDIQVSARSIASAVKAAWERRDEKIKLSSLSIYIKAEEKKAYFVINDNISGYVPLSNKDDLSYDVIIEQ